MANLINGQGRGNNRPVDTQGTANDPRNQTVGDWNNPSSSAAPATAAPVGFWNSGAFGRAASQPAGSHVEQTPWDGTHYVDANGRDLGRVSDVDARAASQGVATSFDLRNFPTEPSTAEPSIQDKASELAKSLGQTQYQNINLGDYNSLINQQLANEQLRYEDYIRGRQNSEVRNQLLLQSHGQGFVQDAANAQLMAGLNAGNNQALSLAGSARGGAGSHALAMRSALAQSALSSQQAATDAAAQRATLSSQGLSNLGNWDTGTGTEGQNILTGMAGIRSDQSTTTANAAGANAAGANNFAIQKPLAQGQLLGIGISDKNAGVNQQIANTQAAQVGHNNTSADTRLALGLGVGATTKKGPFNP